METIEEEASSQAEMAAGGEFRVPPQIEIYRQLILSHCILRKFDSCDEHLRYRNY